MPYQIDSSTIDSSTIDSSTIDSSTIDSSTIDDNVKFVHSQYNCILASQVSSQFLCTTKLI